MESICQIWIVVFGCAAVWMVGRRESWKKWGYVLGLCSQPAWIYTTWKSEQWGILIVAVWYTYAWGHGAYNYWIRPPAKSAEGGPLAPNA
jgi:hypothetical protein